jgi:hypothetical protein
VAYIDETSETLSWLTAVHTSIFDKHLTFAMIARYTGRETDNISRQIACHLSKKYFQKARGLEDVSSTRLFCKSVN